MKHLLVVLTIAFTLLPARARAQDVDPSVVNNAAEDVDLDWEFVEQFRLGGEDEGPEAFFRLHRNVVATDPSGTITILDSDNYRIVQFDSGGSFLRSFGGKGEGPGELSFPVQLTVDASGQVLVYDVRKRALIRFSPTGEDLSQTPADEFGLLMSIAVAGDSLVYETRTRPTAEKTPTRELLVATPTDTTTIATLDEIPSTNQEFRDCGVRISLPPIFAPSLVWRYGSGSIAVSSGPTYEVSISGPAGRLLVRRDLGVRKATPELAVREFGDGMPLGVGGPTATCIIPTADLIEQAGIADTVPYIRDLILAPDGGLWVQRWTFKDEPGLIDVFDSAGVYMGTLTGAPFPIAFQPDGGIITSVEDDLGIQRLVTYSVERD